MKLSNICSVALVVTLAACSSSPQKVASSSTPQEVASSPDPERSVELGPFEFRTYLFDPNRLAVSRELRELDESIDNAKDTGRLSVAAARVARKQVKALAREANRLSHNGLTDMEARAIETSVRGVESWVNAPLRPD